LDALGETDKTAVPNSLTPPVDPTTNQLLITNRGILQVGELAHIAILGPSETQTVAQAWGSVTDVTDFMINLDASASATPPAPTMTPGGSFQVPHAVALLGQFTTISPRHDGEDNDGIGGNDSAGELSIPGLINFNTMPDHLLDKILPIADST